MLVLGAYQDDSNYVLTTTLHLSEPAARKLLADLRAHFAEGAEATYLVN